MYARLGRVASLPESLVVLPWMHYNHPDAWVARALVRLPGTQYLRRIEKCVFISHVNALSPF